MAEQPLSQKELLQSAKSIDDNISNSDVKQAQAALEKISKKPKAKSKK